MTRLRNHAIGLLLAGSIVSSAAAQAPVQQSATKLDAIVSCQEAANPQVNTQNTLTITGGATGFYLTAAGVNVVADGTGGTALSIGRFTTTNLQGLELDVSFAGTVSTQSGYQNLATGAGIKIAAGVSATIVSPAGGAHNAYAMYACGYPAS